MHTLIHEPVGEAGAIRVLAPGLSTTVQDLGRPGYRAAGVPPGGAADPLALAIANLLVGNDEGASALELTLAGPTLLFGADTAAALCGAPFEAWLDGEAMEPMRPYYVPKGAVLSVRRAAAGCRGVLAVAGGIAVPQVLGSRSTYARTRLGGLAGRPLQADDLLPLGPPEARARRLLARLRGRGGARRGPFAAARELAAPAPLPGQAPCAVRAQRGPEASRFAPDALRRFFGEPYTVRPEADRMGARLAGPPLAPQDAASMVSEAVAAGAVQVPPDGQPIVLLPDCGTTGGYPRIAQVAAVDLPLLGQLRPGAKLSFREISLAEAEALYLERRIAIARFQAALGHWL